MLSLFVLSIFLLFLHRAVNPLRTFFYLQKKNYSLRFLPLFLPLLIPWAQAFSLTLTNDSAHLWQEQWHSYQVETNKLFTKYQDNYPMAQIIDSLFLNEYVPDENDALIYADFYALMGDFTLDRFLAQNYYLKANALLEKKGDQEALIASLLEKLLWTYDYLGKDQKKAITLLQESLEIREKLPYSYEYSAALRILAWFYELESNITTASKTYEKALDLDLQYLGFNDIRTVLAFENFALFYIDYEKYREAQEVLLTKKKLHQALTNRDYYNLGRTESMLGWVYMNLYEDKKAENNFLSALQNINQSLTGSALSSHYFSINALLDLVYFYSQVRQFDKALPFYRKAIGLLDYDEEELFIFIQDASPDTFNNKFIGSFPWSNFTHLEGVKSLQDYIHDKEKHYGDLHHW